MGLGEELTTNPMLQIKHHVISGRLNMAKKLLTASKLSLEDTYDEDGNTALHWCAQGLQTETDKREATDVETFVFLMHNAAPRNARNNLGETPLLTVVRMATLEPERAQALIEEMLKQGRVDPCRADMSGETPIMEAAASGLDQIGRLLLEYRANPLAESSSGLTAAQLADESGCAAFVELLKSPLAERAAKEAKAQENDGKTVEEREKDNEIKREKRAKNFEQTLFGQKLRPGLAKDKEQPGKPYPEFGTLHDID